MSTCNFDPSALQKTCPNLLYYTNYGQSTGLISTSQPTILWAPNGLRAQQLAPGQVCVVPHSNLDCTTNNDCDPSQVCNANNICVPRNSPSPGAPSPSYS